MEVYILNQNLAPVALIDAFRSLIWATRYARVGDCELYLSATSENISVLKIGYYLARGDDAMICRIKRVQIDTDVENGNYIIVNGEDTKSYLDQRIVWGTATCKGKAEVFLRSLVNKSLINSDIGLRNLVKPNGGALMKLGALVGYRDAASEQMSYVNIGEKARAYCDVFGWGYRVVLDGDQLAFEIYAGADRSNTVVFSDEYENLASTTYVVDKTNMGNVALCAGEGEGSKRVKSSVGEATGTGRFEIYTDARDVSKSITWAELHTAYPGGSVEPFGSVYGYRVPAVDVMILSVDFYGWLTANYPSGQIVTVDGVEYYRVTNEIVATMETGQPDDTTTATLEDLVYIPYLLNRGIDDLSEYGAVETFEGSVIPDVTFKYKEDYFLGDVVTVRNEYGIEQVVRITEVVEVEDENGYSFEPKFESIAR